MNTSSSRQTVLIVEDDPVMMRGLRDNFEFEGYHVLTATDGEAGLQEAMRATPDLIVLDLMLPKVNGYEICRYLREEGHDVPILMLTARGQEADIVLGLKLGADDYVTKPFSIRELLARADALLRRRRKSAPETHMWGDCCLDLAAHTFTRSGKPIALSPKEWDGRLDDVTHRVGMDHPSRVYAHCGRPPTVAMTYFRSIARRAVTYLGSLAPAD